MAGEKKVHEDSEDRWEQIAPFWDEHMGEGGQFQQVLLGPATERLLDLSGGEQVLDIACGNGMFTRRLAQLGAHAIGIDFSSEFIKRAKERTTENQDKIEYHVMDATNEEQLLSLGAGAFDSAVATMALMDISDIDPLFSALSKLLKPGGSFVFSVVHPCFNSVGVRWVLEDEDREGEYISTRFVKVSKYITPITEEGLGVVSQPVPHYYFHRPLSVLFKAGFAAGFALDGLEEPVFDESENSDNPLGWANFKEIPAALVARMRLVK